MALRKTQQSGAGQGASTSRSQSTGSTGDASTRKRLAMIVVAISVIGIVAISGLAIGFAGANNRADTSKLVFTAVLPLLGTWVGTVLAFYFAQGNLEAATESTLALAGATDTTTPVTAVMIPESDWVTYDAAPGDDLNAVPLSQLYTKMRQLTPPARRLPIRNAAGAVLYVIHDSTLTAYAESVHEASDSLTKTLGDLLGVSEFSQLVSATGYVSTTASVSDARSRMGSIPNCNDVFVTASGKREEHATGWLTNTLLAGVQ
ncbi:MAG TPA: hypothetical protein VF221_09135 [Chloroflexota bacterium]